MAKLEKVETFSLAKPLAIALALVGLVAGILYAVVGAAYDVLRGKVGIGTALAFLAPIGMPSMFATFGFIVGTIGAFLYNFVAEWLGASDRNVEPESPIEFV